MSFYFRGRYLVVGHGPVSAFFFLGLKLPSALPGDQQSQASTYMNNSATRSNLDNQTSYRQEAQRMYSCHRFAKLKRGFLRPSSVIMRIGHSVQDVLRRVRLGAASLAGHKLLSLRSAVDSYELLPTSSELQDTMKQGSHRPSALVLLPVLFLLVITGVSAGLVFRSSGSEGK
jgi:hypothetical protein